MPETSVTIRVAIYARVSTERQEREDTIASQVAQLKDSAAKAGYAVVDVYEDNGYSGGLLARPALDRLRDDAQNKRFDRILIHSPDRLARKFAYQEVVIDELRRYGVEVEFLNRKIAENPEDKLLLGVQGLFAEYEKAKITERVRRGRLHKAGKGLIVGSRAPYGYVYHKGSGRYEISAAEAGIVRMIFDWVANHGYTLRRVVRELTEKSIPKPTGYGHRKAWGRSTIARIIINETYTGTTFYNKWAPVESMKPKSKVAKRMVRTSRKLRPKDQWIPIPAPALIERALFDLAQERLKKNRVMANGRCNNSYLLRGLIQCGSCASPMVGDPGKGRPCYRCSNRDRQFPAPRLCKSRAVRADMIEAKVWGALRRGLQDPQLLISQRKPVQEGIERRAGGHESQLAEFAQERAKLDREENRLLEAYSAEVITLEQMKPQMERLRARKKALEERVQATVPKQQPLDLQDFEAMRRAFLRGLEAADADVTKRQELLRILVTVVKIEPGQVRIIGAIPAPSDGLGTVHNALLMWTETGKRPASLPFEIVEPIAA